MANNKKPYIEEKVIVINRKYNPKYGDDKKCYSCGHYYHRHFDSYEDMKAVGCKYCPCCLFTEKNVNDKPRDIECLNCGHFYIKGTPCCENCGKLLTKLRHKKV